MTDFELGYMVIIISSLLFGMMFSMFANLNERLKELEND